MIINHIREDPGSGDYFQTEQRNKSFILVSIIVKGNTFKLRNENSSKFFFPMINKDKFTYFFLDPNS